jgi:hypothetical protein
MEFKQPYRYDNLQKMKYRDEPAFLHHETMSAQNMLETPMDILDQKVITERDWRLIRYLDDSHWTPNIGLWSTDKWVPGEAIISSTSDGYVYHLDADWDTLHGDPTGSSVEDDLESHSLMVHAQNTPGNPYIMMRAWFYFDLSGFSGTVSSCSLVIRGDTNENEPVSVQKGTQATSLTTADWDSFSGSKFGHVAWDKDGDNTIVFNSTGIAYIQSIVNSAGTALLCCRQYTHDYLDSAPAPHALAGDHAAGGYFADSTTAAYRPRLHINGGGTGTDLSVVSGSWWTDLRPMKFKMTFDATTANVSVQDKDSVELYANAAYPSGSEVYLEFAASDIDKIVVTGSGDITDIELLEQTDKDLYIGSYQRSPRKEVRPGVRRMAFPDLYPIQDSERVARYVNRRAIR